MVRVPQVDLPSVGVNAGALPQFQAGQVAPAQNLAGQGLSQLGQGMEQAGAGLLRLQDRINDSRARAADTEFSEWTRAAISDYRNRKGYDAIQTRDQFMQDLAKKQKELAEGLDNQWQREAFEQRAANRSMYFASTVDDHFIGQSTAYEIGQATAALEANVSDYTDSFSSPVTITDLKDSPFYQDAMRNVATIMQARGVQPGSPMWTQAEEGVRTQMHVNAMASMAQSQDPASRQMARDYYKQHGSSLPLKERTKIEDAMRKMNVDDIAFASTQQLLSAYPGDLKSQIDTLDALRFFGGIDQDEYDATLGKLTQRHNINKTVEAEQREVLRNQYEQSIGQAIGSDADWSVWQTSNAALVSQLRDMGMMDEAQAFWTNRGRVTSIEGQVRMVEYMSQPDMLRAKGDVGKKWREIRSELAPGLSASDLQQVEAAFIRANQLDENGQSPSGGRRAGDVLKIVDDKEFYDRMVGNLFGQQYDKAWEPTYSSGKLTSSGRPEMLDLWFRAQRKLESELNQRRIDKNDRKAVEDYVNSLANSQRMEGVSAEALPGMTVSTAWMQPLVMERMTPTEKQSARWTETLPSGQSKSITLGEWSSNAELRAKVIQHAQSRIKAADEDLRTETDEAVRNALIEDRDTLRAAVQDYEMGGDPSLVAGGSDVLIRSYLRGQIMAGERQRQQEEAQIKLEAAASNAVVNAARGSVLSQRLLAYMPKNINVTPEIAAPMAQAYTDQAIAEGFFGPAESFDTSAFGSAKRKKALELVTKELGQMFASPAYGLTQWPTGRPPMSGEAVVPALPKRAPIEAEPSRGLSPIMEQALKRLREEAAANRKRQLEEQAKAMQDALKARRDSMK